MISRNLVGAAAVLVVAACGSTTNGGDGGAGDAATDTKKGPCDGLGCASGPGKLYVTVKDEQTMAGLGPATFEENGKPVMWSSCTANQMMQCTGTYLFDNLGIGAHTMTAHAAGHAPKMFTAQVLGPTGCCGSGPDSNATVLLTPIDAKMLCTSTGGTVEMLLCCSALPFPDLCGAGACSCAPQSSVMAEVCQCPQNQCFDPEVGCKMR